MTKDEVALLFRKYGAAVYRRARYLLGSHAEAEEATQEVFIRVLGHAEGFEERGQVYKWLLRITTNYCLNHIRDCTRRRDLWKANWEPPPHPADLPGAPSTELLTLMKQLLTEADENLAQVALYRFVDGMGQEEIAGLLGISRRTVVNRLKQFKKWATSRLKACPDPPGGK